MADSFLGGDAVRRFDASLPAVRRQDAVDFAAGAFLEYYDALQFVAGIC